MQNKHWYCESLPRRFLLSRCLLISQGMLEESSSREVCDWCCLLPDNEVVPPLLNYCKQFISLAKRTSVVQNMVCYGPTSSPTAGAIAGEHRRCRSSSDRQQPRTQRTRAHYSSLGAHHFPSGVVLHLHVVERLVRRSPNGATYGVPCHVTSHLLRPTR